MQWAPDSTDLWAPDSGGQLTLGQAADLFLAATAAEGAAANALRFAIGVEGRTPRRSVLCGVAWCRFAGAAGSTGRRPGRRRAAMS